MFNSWFPNFLFFSDLLGVYNTVMFLIFCYKIS